MRPIPWILAAILANARAQDCTVELRDIRYPPLAVQARIQGAVTARLQVDAAGKAVRDSEPELRGHPLLAAAVRDALSRAHWTGCPAGEQSLKFQFQITDPCAGERPFQIKQVLSGTFEITVSGPVPCVYAMTTKTVRRFLIFKKRIDVCEEICPPCPPQ